MTVQHASHIGCRHEARQSAARPRRARRSLRASPAVRAGGRAARRARARRRAGPRSPWASRMPSSSTRKPARGQRVGHLPHVCLAAGGSPQRDRELRLRDAVQVEQGAVDVTNGGGSSGHGGVDDAGDPRERRGDFGRIAASRRRQCRCCRTTSLRRRTEPAISAVTTSGCRRNGVRQADRFGVRAREQRRAFRSCARSRSPRASSLPSSRRSLSRSRAGRRGRRPRGRRAIAMPNASCSRSIFSGPSPGTRMSSSDAVRQVEPQLLEVARLAVLDEIGAVTASVAGPMPRSLASSPERRSGARSSVSSARTALAAPRYARDLNRFSARSSSSAAISDST